MGKITATIEMTNTADALAVDAGYVEAHAVRKHTISNQKAAVPGASEERSSVRKGKS